MEALTLYDVQTKLMINGEHNVLIGTPSGPAYVYCCYYGGDCMYFCLPTTIKIFTIPFDNITAGTARVFDIEPMGITTFSEELKEALLESGVL